MLQVRKIAPLARALGTLEVWITGLRKGQAVTRREIQKVEWDETNNLLKLNPLADWTEEQVWRYIRTHQLPYNKLHDRGYPSIGCAPCTMAVKPGEYIRAGRWWWRRRNIRNAGSITGSVAAGPLEGPLLGPGNHDSGKYKRKEEGKPEKGWNGLVEETGRKCR